MKKITLEVGDGVQYNFNKNNEPLEMSIIESIKNNRIDYTDGQFDFKDKLLKDIENGNAIIIKGKNKAFKFPILIEFYETGSNAVIMSPNDIPINQMFKVIATNITIKG